MSFGAFNPISGAGLDPSSLIDDGVIELDGDKLSITWAPVNTTPDSSIAQADSTDDLSAILAGIDNALSFLNDTDNPNGFVDKGGIGTSPDSQFSVDDGTRTFTLEPTGSSFNVYMGGFRTTISSTLTVQWADTEGIHHFYVDTDGTLTTGTAFPSNLISELAYVANLYWDATNNVTLFLGEERHGIIMDSDSHIYHHQVDGSRYQEGFGLTLTADGNGSSNTHAQLAVADGVFRDEDVTHTIADDAPQVMTPIAALPVFYQSGTTGTWRKKTADTYPFVQSGAAGYTGANGRAAYNQNNGGTWQLTELGQGGCVLLHIFATNDVNTPIIVILGQAEYASALTARAGAITELQTLVTASLPSQEFVPIGTVILQSSTAYANDVNARFIQTDGGDDYVDWRATTITSGVGTSIPSHSVLSDLDNDDHTQYVLADGTRDITGEIVLQGGAALGTGDGGATAATGGTLRAPNVVAGGTDVAGADLTIAAGLGTGAGDVGTIIFQTPRVLGSGTTQQSLTTLMTLDEGTVTVAGNVVANDVTVVSGDFNLDVEQVPAFSIQGTSVIDRPGASTRINLLNGSYWQSLTVMTNQIVRLTVASDGDLVVGNDDAQATARNDGTIRASDVAAGGTDIAGADLYVVAGLGTGAGDPGRLLFQTAPSLGSGTTQHTAVTSLTIGYDPGNTANVVGLPRGSLLSLSYDIGVTQEAFKADASNRILVYADNGLRLGFDAAGIAAYDADYYLGTAAWPFQNEYLYNALWLGRDLQDSTPVNTEFRGGRINAGTGNNNIDGHDITFKTAVGTGTGDPGTFIFQTARSAASGDTQHTLTTLMTLDEATVTIAGVILNGDGTQAAPAYSFANGLTVGLYRNGSGAPAMGVNNNEIQTWNQANVILYTDTYFDQAVIVGEQADGSSLRGSGTLRAADVTGSPTDIAGADLTIRPGIGSGAGDVGTIIFQTPRVEASGTTLQTPTTLMTLDEATVTIAGDLNIGSGGQVLNDTGATNAPSYSFDGYATAGMYYATSGNQVAITANNFDYFKAGSNTVQIYANTLAAVSSPVFIVGDSSDNQNLRNSGLLRAADRSGSPTDGAGADLTIRPGIGSGAGDVGTIIFQTPRVEASGTTLQTPVTILTLDGPNMQVDGLIVANGNGTDVFQFAADATDPTGGGGAATGRIPVSIGGGTVYLAYY